MVIAFHQASIRESDDVPPEQDIPARARQILASPGIITGADALELRDLSSTLLWLPSPSCGNRSLPLQTVPTQLYYKISTILDTRVLLGHSKML